MFEYAVGLFTQYRAEPRDHGDADRQGNDAAGLSKAPPLELHYTTPPSASTFFSPYQHLHYTYSSLTNFTMYLRNLGAFASLALVGSAVLIPPSFTADDLGDDLAMETLAVNPFKRTVALDCPGCAFASNDGKSISWTQNAGNSFVRHPKTSALTPC
jgi:hypothetical protein